jgi:protoporphyrinogen oxidase
MILIIGGGISGLSVANFIKNKNYLIIEKESEPGGYCRTIKKDGFVWDYSGHFFHFRDKQIKNYLLSEMDISGLITVQKHAQIYYNGQFIDFPFQKNIHQLPKEEFIDCMYDLYFRPTKKPSNFKEMLVSRFGKSICEKFLFPYNEKLYACELNKLDVDAMGRFFPYANIDEIIKNFKLQDNSSYNSSFTYHRGGAIEYVKSLLKRIDADKLALNEKLISIDPKRHIATTNRRKIKYDILISSIPFNKLLNLSNISFDEKIYSYNKVLVFNLGFNQKGDDNNHWVYFPERKYCFYRIGYYDNIFGDSRMSLYVELGLKKDEDYNEKSMLELVLKDLRSAGIISNHRLISYHSVLLDPAYVHITQKSQDDVTSKMKILKMHNIYSIGRYGGWKYCSIEDNIIEAKDLVNNLNI